MAKILIVDDEAALLSVQVTVLQEAGHAVVTATNGKEALLAIESEPFDLLITDVIMPEKDGLETIAHLHRERPTLKIIAVSGGGYVAPKNYLAMASRLGATQTLTKPFTAEQLLKAVGEVLGSKKG